MPIEKGSHLMFYDLIHNTYAGQIKGRTLKKQRFISKRPEGM